MKIHKNIRKINKTICEALSVIPVASLLASGIAAAHHSFGMFDPHKIVVLDGALYAAQWEAPHSWIWLSVPNAFGGKDIWALEAASPGEFLRQGVKKSDLTSIGLKMKVEMHPLWNGQKGGQFLRATLADGRIVGSLKTPIELLQQQGIIQGNAARP